MPLLCPTRLPMSLKRNNTIIILTIVTRTIMFKAWDDSIFGCTRDKINRSVTMPHLAVTMTTDVPLIASSATAAM